VNRCTVSWALHILLLLRDGHFDCSSTRMISFCTWVH
jgi:hypothetical protein